jgi:nitroreductase
MHNDVLGAVLRSRGMLGKLADDFWVQDRSAATENMLVAVAALGLGAVRLGGRPGEKREPRIQHDARRVHSDVPD